jgi:hypothetical protein
VLLRQDRAPDDGAVAAAQPGDQVGIAFRPQCGLLIGDAAPRGAHTTDPTLEEAIA